MSTFLWRVKNWFLKLLRTLGGLFGIDLFNRKTGFHYVPDYFGRSAHKQKDIRLMQDFGELAEFVMRDKRSSLYYDRLFTIYQIISNLALSRTRKTDQTFQTVEVGVYKGGTSYFIASLAEKLSLKLHHYCFDTFEGHSGEDINQSVEISHTSGTFSDTSFESVSQYLKAFSNVSVFKGRFQDTCQVVENTKLNFVHLDMDIYEPTIFALKFFDQKLVSGGIILVDDFGFDTCPGIQKAIKEFTESHTGYFGMALLTGQYLLVKN